MADTTTIPVAHYHDIIIKANRYDEFVEAIGKGMEDWVLDFLRKESEIFGKRNYKKN